MGAEPEIETARDSVFNLALESVPYAISVWDTNACLVFYNQAYIDFFYDGDDVLRLGQSLKEVCAISVHCGVHEDRSVESVFENAWEHFKECAQADGPITRQRELRSRLVRSRLVCVPGGGWVTTHDDISDELQRVQLEREHEKNLARRNMWLESAVNNMRDGICMFGADSRLIICNNRYIEIYNLPPEMTKPGTHVDDIYKYRLENGLAASEATHDCPGGLLENAGHEQETICKVRDRLISVFHKPMQDGGWVGTHRDITNQKRKEALFAQRSQDLEKQTIRFTGAVENMTQGLSLFGSDQRLIICNQVFADIYQLPDQLTRPGTPLEDILNHRTSRGTSPELEREKNTLLSGLTALQNEKDNHHQVIIQEQARTILIIRRAMPDGGWVSTHQDITEQERNAALAEKRSAEIERQNMFFNAAVNNMSQGLSLYNADRQLVICNEPYAHIYDLTPHLAQPGTSFWDIVDHCASNKMVAIDDPTIRRTELERVIQENQFVTVEIEMINGKVMSITHQPLADGGWLAVHEDITERRKALAATERLSRIVERSLNEIFVFDAKTLRFTEVNLGARRNLGYTMEELTRLTACDIKPEISKSQFLEIIEPLMDGTEEQSVFETIHQRKDGTIYNVEVHLQLMCDEEASYFVAIVNDVTERRHKEALIKSRNEEVARQNIRFNAAVNNMAHGLSMFDSEKKLIVCNAPFAEIYQLPETLVQPGTGFWEIYEYREQNNMISLHNADPVREDLEQSLANGKERRNSVELADGRVLLITHTPIQDGGWLSTHEDITEQHRSQETIEHLARHDSLTDLPNRTSFLNAMEGVQKQITAGASMAVISIDLDHFKPINDNFGHAIGDLVLEIAASRISKTIGDRGFSARLGGDEFAVLVGPLQDTQKIATIAEEVIAAISVPMRVDGLEANLGATIGIAISPDDGTATDTLMRNSDLALYCAKNDSRGSYCFFEREMDDVRKRRREIESGLKKALAENKLTMYYQPLMSLDENRVICCEALMRWTSEEHGIVSPMEFIPIAEETGFIRDMGVWALQQACTTAADWPEHVRVAVNVSPVQFKGHDLVAHVKAALKTSGLAPKRLELEITESLFLANSDHNLAILHALRKMGVRIALDDFGTGYSSLSYLSSFPFDKIKIDRSFVSELSDNPETEAIVRAVAQLGRELGMTTTAEGVETEAQLDLVRSLGCVEMQGYLFSPPLPQSAISRLAGLNPTTEPASKNHLSHVTDNAPAQTRRSAIGHGLE